MDTSARPTKAKSSEKKTFYVKFSDFLRKYRMIVLIIFGAALVAVVGVAVSTAIKDSQLKASTASLEKLDADYSTYSSEQDPAKKADLEKSFITLADQMSKKWQGRYAGQKALAYKAKIEESNKDWAAAEKDWLDIVSSAPSSYLAPIALQGAATAAEEQGAVDRAIADYRKLVDKYSDQTIGMPHAYFSLGRLSEQSKDYTAALTAYQKVASSWPESDWTKLATDRILFMKSSGMIK
jgi:tetratricopeptide (TPR) repeat protein